MGGGGGGVELIVVWLGAAYFAKIGLDVQLNEMWFDVKKKIKDTYLVTLLFLNV